ncbi:uncharacterized protein LOC115726822 isoform X2 [Rhodamnia argentea]|uniref:Uncharacterized protein LOC115726822 isoform X2 n=1 Tax=Rhodamnia argentea TaxID=178133 RepID=A0A8B8MQ82_9MYRT|nr:uncharacterized protein LOC115726822 isoform X2 [Rhodamnia argentea]
MDDCARLSTYEESRRPSSPPTSRNCSATLSSEDPSPIRHVLCVTRDEDIKRFEETEDCFILGFDPFQRFCRLYVSTTEAGGTDAEDLVVVAEKGQLLLMSMNRWPVETSRTRGIFVRNFPLRLHLTKDTVSCATAMYAIQLPPVRTGPVKATVMPRSTTKSGSQ